MDNKTVSADVTQPEQARQSLTVTFARFPPDTGASMGTMGDRKEPGGAGVMVATATVSEVEDIGCAAPFSGRMQAVVGARKSLTSVIRNAFDRCGAPFMSK